MGILKIGAGFHTAVACFCDGIGDYLSNLAAGGNIITAKCVDGTSSLMDFQREIMNGAEGYGVYRCFKGHDIPNYGAPVETEAQRYMDKINLYYPPELDKNLFYIEMINECDKKSV